MDEQNHQIRFEGCLWENMVFEHIPGWETLQPSQKTITGDGSYTVDLLTENGQFILSKSPKVDFRHPCPPEPFGLALADVLIYVPLHPQAHDLIFRRGDFVIFRAPLTSQPPVVRIEEIQSLGEDRFRVRWDAEHSLPISFDMVYLDDQKRTFTLARGLIEREFTADLRTLPGGNEGRISILATDGLRSAYALTEPFRVTEKPPVVWIQSPKQEEILPADQPVTLCGQALDLASENLPEEALLWRIDGETIASGMSLALAQGLQPGLHEVQLEYSPDGHRTAFKTVPIQIAERSSAQEELLQLLASL